MIKNRLFKNHSLPEAVQRKKKMKIELLCEGNKNIRWSTYEEATESITLKTTEI